jgi:hypothetical protein
MTVLGDLAVAPAQREKHCGGDAGSVTVATLILAVGFLMVVSLVYFQGVKLRAGRQAGNIAEEAARAGAGQLDRDRAYSSGATAVDAFAARSQARAYLTAAGVSGTVTVSAARSVTVTVTFTQPAPGLGLIGVDSISVTRTASATLVPGVGQANP